MAGSSKDKRKATSANPADLSADKGARAPAKTKTGREANWTDGLKKLYDNVVDEPLPDSFRDLLSKLDSED